MKCARIDAQRRDFGLDEMCALLDVSESGYRSWKHGGKPHRKRLTDAQMLTLIQAIPVEFKGNPPLEVEGTVVFFNASWNNITSLKIPS